LIELPGTSRHCRREREIAASGAARTGFKRRSIQRLHVSSELLAHYRIIAPAGAVFVSMG
jgi:hypothetical protein